MGKLYNSIIGFSIGDALGVPVKNELRKNLVHNKIVDMIGYGSFDFKEGTYSDDTSLVLATIDSICNIKYIDYDNIANCYLDWLLDNKYSCGKTFDVGVTTKASLIKYSNVRCDAHLCGGCRVNDNGNGALKRVLPLAFYFFYSDTNESRIVHVVEKFSSITHGNDVCMLGSFIYVLFTINILKGLSKEEAYSKLNEFEYSKYFNSNTIDLYSRVINLELIFLDSSAIKSSGYCIDTLEAVIWSILNGKDFSSSVLLGVNLGDCSDSIGALIGGIAGIIYGDIPVRWIDKLTNHKYIEDLCYKYLEVLNQ
ncbi:MAG: ADP-ribosylglycohydrolase family protein [Erysipelotrichaceae bacterium]